MALSGTPDPSSSAVALRIRPVPQNPAPRRGFAEQDGGRRNRACAGTRSANAVAAFRRPASTDHRTGPGRAGGDHRGQSGGGMPPLGCPTRPTGAIRSPGRPKAAASGLSRIAIRRIRQSGIMPGRAGIRHRLGLRTHHTSYRTRCGHAHEGRSTQFPRWRTWDTEGTGPSANTPDADDAAFSRRRAAPSRRRQRFRMRPGNPRLGPPADSAIDPRTVPRTASCR